MHIAVCSEAGNLQKGMWVFIVMLTSECIQKSRPFKMKVHYEPLVHWSLTWDLYIIIGINTGEIMGQS
jgi:low affinity Fe/Cu permease